ncbi:Hypothetical predicted protein [Octopus vulgaris]|uniref:Vitelline envelope sperm lysin receptor C-terminal domain-containing protein n=1 Tax=Octopus vulgaris TaxID=6645 RepID=A0AA36BVC4_OCTVU|nr:Hypothetical predicted protein [Octopus vulgaris]
MDEMVKRKKRERWMVICPRMLKEHLYGWYPAVNGDSKMSTYLTECLYRNQRPKSCRPFNSGIPTIGGIIRQKTALQTELEMTPKEFLSRCKSAPGSSRSSSKPFVFQRQSTFHRSQCREYRVPDQPKRPSTCHVVSSVQNKHLFNKTRSPKRSEGLVLTNEQLNQSRKTPHNDVDFSSADHRISQNDSPGNSLTEAISKERCDDEKNRISVLNYEEGQEITLTCKKVRSLALKEAELYNPDSYRQNLRKNGWLMQVEGNIFGLKFHLKRVQGSNLLENGTSWTPHDYGKEFSLLIIYIFSFPLNDGKDIVIDTQTTAKGITPVWCLAHYRRSKIVILNNGCGNGTVIPKISGFHVASYVSWSPVFKLPLHSSQSPLEIECQFGLCKDKCDGILMFGVGNGSATVHKENI